MTIRMRNGRWCHYCGKICTRHNTTSHFQFKRRRSRAQSLNAKRWQARNPEKRKAIVDRYLAKRPRTKYHRRYYQENKARYRSNKIRWESSHRRLVAAAVGRRLKRAYSECRDWYIAKLLRSAKIEVTHENIEQYRKQLQAKRSRRVLRSIAAAGSI